MALRSLINIKLRLCRSPQPDNTVICMGAGRIIFRGVHTITRGVHRLFLYINICQLQEFQYSTSCVMHRRQNDP